jgi:5-methylcytosine-specific restriction enzyme A
MKELRPRVAMIGTRLGSHSVVYDKRIRGRRLQAERARHFKDNPLCQMCEAEGLVQVWTELDHVVALVNGGADAGQKQGLCKRHHLAKTKQDIERSKGMGG